MLGAELSFSDPAPDWDLLLSRHAVVLQFVSKRKASPGTAQGSDGNNHQGAPNALGSWMIRK